MCITDPAQRLSSIVVALLIDTNRVAIGRQVYKPLLDVQSDWGETPDDGKAEFLEGMTRVRTPNPA